MGVTIEQYHMFIQAVRFMSQLKVKFWNQMLIMFYLKVFYLPCLKNLVTRTEKMVMFACGLQQWHTTMSICHYCRDSLMMLKRILVLINEVVDNANTVCAGLNQGNQFIFCIQCWKTMCGNVIMLYCFQSN